MLAIPATHSQHLFRGEPVTHGTVWITEGYREGSGAAPAPRGQGQ